MTGVQTCALPISCVPAPSFSIAQVDSGYRPVLEALQTTLSARIPDLNWSPTEPAGSFRDGRKCWVTILAHGYAPELVHWDDELRNSINATITQYGFAGQSRYSGETGGWVVMSSHDDAGVELEVATKAEIQLAIPGGRPLLADDRTDRQPAGVRGLPVRQRLDAGHGGPGARCGPAV